MPAPVRLMRSAALGRARRREPVPAQHHARTHCRIHTPWPGRFRHEVQGQPVYPEQRERAGARGDPVRYRQHPQPGGPASDVAVEVLSSTPLDRFRIRVVDAPGDPPPTALPDQQCHRILVDPRRVALGLAHQPLLRCGSRQQRLRQDSQRSHVADPTLMSGSPGAVPAALWTTAPSQRLWSSSRADTAVIPVCVTGGLSDPPNVGFVALAAERT